jgi:hypothetical protein
VVAEDSEHLRDNRIGKENSMRNTLSLSEATHPNPTCHQRFPLPTFNKSSNFSQKTSSSTIIISTSSALKMAQKPLLKT